MHDRDDLQFAFDASDHASALALRYFEEGVSATLKTDGSQVTEADRAVERLLHEKLSVGRPDDALLGEELGRLGESDRVWVIDPVDGTAFFSRRDPNWRVHLALQVAGRTELAVVTAPALGRCWWATRGGGAFASSWPRSITPPQRLGVSETSSLHDADLQALGDASHAELPEGAFRPSVSPLPLVELVNGEIDAFLVERYHLWDHAPWILLVEEAGGRFTDRAGGRAGDQGGGLYSNANLHTQLLKALAYPTRR